MEVHAAHGCPAEEPQTQHHEPPDLGLLNSGVNTPILPIQNILPTTQIMFPIKSVITRRLRYDKEKNTGQ